MRLPIVSAASCPLAMAAPAWPVASFAVDDAVLTALHERCTMMAASSANTASAMRICTPFLVAHPIIAHFR